MTAKLGISLKMEHNNILTLPYKLSSTLTLKNRIVMAPMTRRRALPDHTPHTDMADYYARRAAAGLIVTEATLISLDAIGYGNVPGIFTQKHINAWKKIVEKVHDQNGRIFLQLWHCGRVSHFQFHQGLAPISSSATTANVILGSTQLPCSIAREANKKEIQQIITDYAVAAKSAINAGFDGVELHGANGYLLDQFLHYATNKRNDEYGGEPENMARFVLQVINACGNEIGFEKIGLRLSPAGYLNDIATHQKDKETFKYLLAKTSALNIAYIHTGNFDDSNVYPELDGLSMTKFLRHHYSGTLIASGGYDLISAQETISQGHCDLVAIGRLFIANPDLISFLNLNTNSNSNLNLNSGSNRSLKSYSSNMLNDLF